MPGDGVVSEKLLDGSISVWCRGWTLCFPTDGGQPTSRRDGVAPIKGAGQVDGLIVRAVGDLCGIGYDGWIVLVPAGSGAPEVVPASPHTGVKEHFYDVIRAYQPGED